MSIDASASLEPACISYSVTSILSIVYRLNIFILNNLFRKLM